MDCSLPVSSVHGILQARILEWVSMSFSRGSSQPRDRTQLSALGGGLSTIWATREALAVLEFPASLSWETHTGFLPVRPVILGFSCTEWVNTYLENRIPRSVCLRWSVLRWAETYLQCHPWLLGHYCELEEGRAGLGVGGSSGWREMSPSSSSHPWGLTGESWSPGTCLGCLSLHFPSCPLYSFLHIPDRRRIYWWSLPPHPHVWGQGLWRLRPRGGTSQGGKECRSLILLESLLLQPGLHSQSWDSWIYSISEAYGARKIMCIHGSLISFFPCDPKMYIY